MIFTLARGTGDPHYLDIAQNYFHFHGKGEFLLMEIGPERSQLQGFLRRTWPLENPKDVTGHMSFAFGEPGHFAYQVSIVLFLSFLTQAS